MIAFFRRLWLIIRRWPEPPHTLESVARELIAGLKDGSIVLDRDDATDS